VRGIEHRLLIALPLAGQVEPVHHVVGRNRLGGAAAVVQLARREWRKLAQPCDRDVELDVVQGALEAEAEQRAKRLALAQAVEQPLRFARASRREIDGEWAVGRGRAGGSEMRVAQQGGGGRMGHGGRVDEARVVIARDERAGLAGRQRRHRRHGRGRSRPQLFDPAVGADIGALRRARHHRGEPLGGERRDPRVEPVRREIERALHEILQGLAVAVLQMDEAAAEISQRCRGRRVEGGEALEVLAHGRAAGDAGSRLIETPGPRRRWRRLRRIGDEVDELGVAQERRGITARNAARDEGGGVGQLAQQRMAQQELQQARCGGGRRWIGSRLRECRDAGLRQQRRDVVGLKAAPRRDLAVLHQRRRNRPRRVGADRAGEARTPRDAQALQDAGRECIVRGDETVAREILAQEGAQVLQVVTPQHGAGAVAAGEPIHAHDVGEIGIRSGGRPAAETERVADARAPDVVAQLHQQIAQPGVGRHGLLLAGRGLPLVERGHREHAVGLMAATQSRIRTPAAHIVDEMIARPRQDGGRQAGAVEAHHVAEVVAPADLPQCGVHAAHVEPVVLGGLPDAPEHRHDRGCGQP
jgi:hypothetical protein